MSDFHAYIQFYHFLSNIFCHNTTSYVKMSAFLNQRIIWISNTVDDSRSFVLETLPVVWFAIS